MYWEAMEPPWKTLSSFMGFSLDGANEILFRLYPHLWPLGYQFDNVEQVKKVFQGNLFSYEKHEGIFPQMGQLIGDLYPFGATGADFNDLLPIVDRDQTYLAVVMFYDEMGSVDFTKLQTVALPKVVVKGPEFLSTIRATLMVLYESVGNNRIPRFHLSFAKDEDNYVVSVEKTER